MRNGVVGPVILTSVVVLMKKIAKKSEKVDGMVNQWEAVDNPLWGWEEGREGLHRL